MNNNRGNNRRRGRGNNRPQNGGQQLNRIDSRARGNAPQLLEKYRKLAQDAHLNGDRVQAEYYLQFADHYFRVIADTRVRQDEQRQRSTGGGAERWQDSEMEDDTGEFAVDSDFPTFDRQQPARRDEPRERDGPREFRDRTERADRDRQERDRQERDRPERDRPERDRAEREPRGRRFEPQVAADEPLPGEGVRADEGEPIVDVTENPFVRDTRGSRGLRPRTERKPRREVPVEAAFDPSSLPPAIGARSEPDRERADEVISTAGPAPEPAPVLAAEPEAAPAPRKRGRPRKTPLPETPPETPVAEAATAAD